MARMSPSFSQFVRVSRDTAATPRGITGGASDLNLRNCCLIRPLTFASTRSSSHQRSMRPPTEKPSGIKSSHSSPFASRFLIEKNSKQVHSGGGPSNPRNGRRRPCDPPYWRNRNSLEKDDINQKFYRGSFRPVLRTNGDRIGWGVGFGGYVRGLNACFGYGQPGFTPIA